MWPTGLAYGGDYNPEQWDETTWAEDDKLMREARLNLVAVGVFSWALLEPEEGQFEFGWLDATIDRLHANGVRVALATPTASPPPWFTFAHPEALPVSDAGVRLTHGSRDTYCAASPAYRAAALRITEALAERYASHPALALWHIHNEYGTWCWCDNAAAAFRRWLQARYGAGREGLTALNNAWGTAFWSQHYTSWEHVLPPRATQYLHNPSQSLDFRRFWSDELLAAYREQRDVIRNHCPDVPATTNMMLPADYQPVDLWSFGREVDVVGIDHYIWAPGVDGDADSAFGADRARSFGGGRPWLLVEQAGGTITLDGRRVVKESGRILRSSLGHIARGADGAMFFQWRASKAGSEMWHTGMVPHAGPDTRIFRETAETGAALERIAEVAGSVVSANVAILMDSDAWWALDGRILPSPDFDYLREVKRAHRALWDAGVTCDVAHPEQDLSRYRLLLAPSLYLVSDAGAANLRGYVENGGVLLVQYFSGIVDDHNQVRTGGYPGAFREILGIRVEEFHPLPPDTRLRLSSGATGQAWAEDIQPEGCAVIATYADGSLAGKPAITRHEFGAGTGWYLSTNLDRQSYQTFMTSVLAEAGVSPDFAGLPPGVEAVRRRADDGRSWLFLLNHTDDDVAVAASGVELLSGMMIASATPLCLKAGAAAVVRESATETVTR